MKEQDQPYYQLTVELITAQRGGVLVHSQHMPYEVATGLGNALIAVIQRVFDATSQYPAVGDHLVLADRELDKWELALQEGELADWKIKKRSFAIPSLSDSQVRLLFDLSLARLDLLGPPDEALDLEELLRVLPTPQARRVVREWALDSQKPVKTWQQLARRGRELKRERGFNVQHMTLIMNALYSRGLALDK